MRSFFFLVVALFGALVVTGCPEHHRVEPPDGGGVDAPSAPLALCTSTSVRCMFPVSDSSCPERMPDIADTCPENGVTCAYCPGGDFGISGAQTRTCVSRRWSASRVDCGSAP